MEDTNIYAEKAVNNLPAEITSHSLRKNLIKRTAFVQRSYHCATEAGQTVPNSHYEQCF